MGYDSWDTGYVGDKTAHPGPIDNSLLLQGRFYIIITSSHSL